MRMLRWLFAIALVCGLNGAAKADDFQMVVIDPLGGAVITNASFTFGFTPCDPGEVPGDTAGFYVGCFVGENGTGVPITRLHFSIPPIPGQPTQGAACDPYGSGLDLFTASCSTSANGFTLDFTGGSIPIGGFFLVAEHGVAADAFPDVNALANAAANTPEPGSFWLLSTGTLLGGLFLADWRRRTVAEPNFKR